MVNFLPTGQFSCFFVACCCRFLLLCFVSKRNFFEKKSFRIPAVFETVWVLAGPDVFDLGSNCLQRLSVDSTSRQRVYSLNQYV